MRQRIAEVAILRLRGYEFIQIRDHFHNQGANLTDEQIWYAIRKSDDHLQKNISTDLTEHFRQHLQQRKRLYSLAVSSGDIATAHRILKDEAELLGLYPAKKTELSGPNGGPIQHAHVDLLKVIDEMNLSLDVRRRLLDEMQAKRLEEKKLEDKVVGP